MGVFDPRQGQVLIQPVTEYYRGKAIRQDLKDKEQMAELRGLQIDEAKYEASPERRKQRDDAIKLQMDKARTDLETAELTLGANTLAYMAKTFGPLMAEATEIAIDPKGGSEAAVQFWNEGLQEIIPGLPTSVQKMIKEGAGDDHVYDIKEIADTKLRLAAWGEREGVERKPRSVLVDGKPAEVFSDKMGNFYYANGKMVTGEVAPYSKPLVTVEGSKFESSASKAYGEKIGGQAAARDEQAHATFADDANLNRIELAMARGARTGYGENIILDIRGALETIGFMDMPEGAQESEVIRSIGNLLALRLRNPKSGLGLTGNTSNKDLGFLMDSVAGINRSEGGNLLLIKSAKKLNEFKRAIAAEQARIIGEADGDIPLTLSSQLLKFGSIMPEYTEAEAWEEARRRGILSADQVAAYEEASKRGLLSGADRTPITLQESTRMIGGKDPTPYTFPHPAQSIADEGIDPITGAPTGRFGASFAQNEALAVEYLTKHLSEHYGQEIKVGKGEHGLEFINPKTGHMTLVDESVLTMRDAAEFGSALPVVGAVIGGVAGATVGYPNLGAAAGGGIGDAIRRTIGQVLGVREASFGREAGGAVGTGIVEGLFSKVGEGAVRVVQKIRNFFKPQVISGEVAAKLSVAAEQDQAIANAISERTGVKVQPFTGQLTNDPTLLGHQSSLKTDPETAIRFRQQQVQNETGLEVFYDQLNPVSPNTHTATGRAIQIEARDQTRPRIEAARDSVDQAVDDLETITRELPAGENSVIVNEATAAAAASREIVKAEEDVAWNAWKGSIGLDPDTSLSSIKVPIKGGLERQMRVFAAEAKHAIDPEDAAGKFRLMPNAFKPKKEQVLNLTTGRVSTKSTPAEVDLWQLQTYIGSLKRRLRLKYGKTALDPTGRDINRQLDAAIKQRDEFLKANHPELVRPLANAEQLTAIRADQFDKGLVSQLLRREGGEWTITDAQLVGGVIGTGDKEAMEHLVAAFSRHPAGLATLQRSFLRHYRNEVVQDGVPSGPLHRKFVENREGAISALFPGENRITQLGEFEKIATAKIQRFTDFEKAMTKTFRGKIQNISPEHVVSKVFSDRFSVKDVSYLMQLAKAAGVDDLYSSAIRAQIRHKFYSETSGIQQKSLETFFHVNEEKIVAALGGRYFRDMQLLQQGLKTIRNTETGIATTRRPGLLATIAEGMARSTFARPLSREGVAMTRGIGFYQRAKNRAWARLVEDPDVLRAIIANARVDAQSETGARLLALVGGDYLYGEAAESFSLEQLQEMNK
jgi:hypothetical protein